jgi:ubiquinone/menaquinone biosynthesis C-methylase UbiE
VKLFQELRNYLFTNIKSPSHNIYTSEAAYNIWAENYDNEQNNLMMYYDKIILTDLIYKINLKEKVILDYGCGTGRHWPEIIKHNPEKIIGCDLSKEMIGKLKLKFYNAEAYIVKDDKLSFLMDNSVDTIISTLVIAHLKNIEKVFAEWNRVLKDSSNIIITDFHPELLAAGGARTFIHKKTYITIENYIHDVAKIEQGLFSFGFRRVSLIEKKIEPDVKNFYEKNNALQVYEEFEGIPFIYGILLSRQHAVK